MTESPQKDEGRRKIKPRKPDDGDESSWSVDQKKRGYYYDDAHGYEIYEPQDDEDNEDNSEK